MDGNFIKRFVSCLTLVAFLTSSTPGVGQVYAQTQVPMPAPGTMVAVSPALAPAIFKGIKVYPQEPLRFDFVVDTGRADLSDADLKDESTKLIRYFLASLTTPEEDLWVNLSPYEGDRIVPDAFGQTEMGRDLLAQDYLLKQITSSIIYPEGDIGKRFWADVYKKAQETYGTTDIPVDTFNKVWITPEEATVYVNGNAAVIKSSHLQVLLESDYLARQKEDPRVASSGVESSSLSDNSSQEIAKSVLREIVIPILEKDVNEGANFEVLRQIYHAMVLATWFKRNLKESLVGRVYTDQNKVKGIDLAEKGAKEEIWKQYVQAFKKGAFNYIKEEADEVTGDLIPRKYFSGGFKARQAAMRQETATPSEMAMAVAAGNSFVAQVQLSAPTMQASDINSAMKAQGETEWRGLAVQVPARMQEARRIIEAAGGNFLDVASELLLRDTYWRTREGTIQEALRRKPSNVPGYENALRAIVTLTDETEQDPDARDFVVVMAQGAVIPDYEYLLSREIPALPDQESTGDYLDIASGIGFSSFIKSLNKDRRYLVTDRSLFVTTYLSEMARRFGVKNVDIVRTDISDLKGLDVEPGTIGTLRLKNVWTYVNLNQEWWASAGALLRENGRLVLQNEPTPRGGSDAFAVAWQLYQDLVEGKGWGFEFKVGHDHADLSKAEFDTVVFIKPKDGERLAATRTWEEYVAQGLLRLSPTDEISPVKWATSMDIDRVLRGYGYEIDLDARNRLRAEAGDLLLSDRSLPVKAGQIVWDAAFSSSLAVEALVGDRAMTAAAAQILSGAVLAGIVRLQEAVTNPLVEWIQRRLGNPVLSGDSFLNALLKDGESSHVALLSKSLEKVIPHFVSLRYDDKEGLFQQIKTAMPGITEYDMQLFELIYSTVMKISRDEDVNSINNLQNVWRFLHGQRLSIGQATPELILERLWGHVFTGFRYGNKAQAYLYSEAILRYAEEMFAPAPGLADALRGLYNTMASLDPVKGDAAIEKYIYERINPLFLPLGYALMKKLGDRSGSIPIPYRITQSERVLGGHVFLVKPAFPHIYKHTEDRKSWAFRTGRYALVNEESVDNISWQLKFVKEGGHGLGSLEDQMESDYRKVALKLLAAHEGAHLGSKRWRGPANFCFSTVPSPYWQNLIMEELYSFMSEIEVEGYSLEATATIWDMFLRKEVGSHYYAAQFLFRELAGMKDEFQMGQKVPFQVREEMKEEWVKLAQAKNGALVDRVKKMKKALFESAMNQELKSSSFYVEVEYLFDGMEFAMQTAVADRAMNTLSAKSVLAAWALALGALVHPVTALAQDSLIKTWEPVRLVERRLEKSAAAQERDWSRVAVEKLPEEVVEGVAFLSDRSSFGWGGSSSEVRMEGPQLLEAVNRLGEAIFKLSDAQIEQVDFARILTSRHEEEEIQSRFLEIMADMSRQKGPGIRKFLVKQALAALKEETRQATFASVYERFDPFFAGILEQEREKSFLTPEKRADIQRLHEMLRSLIRSAQKETEARYRFKSDDMDQKMKDVDGIFRDVETLAPNHAALLRGEKIPADFLGGQKTEDEAVLAQMGYGDGQILVMAFAKILYEKFVVEAGREDQWLAAVDKDIVGVDRQAPDAARKLREQAVFFFQEDYQSVILKGILADYHFVAGRGYATQKTAPSREAFFRDLMPAWTPAATLVDLRQQIQTASSEAVRLSVDLQKEWNAPPSKEFTIQKAEPAMEQVDPARETAQAQGGILAAFKAGEKTFHLAPATEDELGQFFSVVDTASGAEVGSLWYSVKARKIVSINLPDTEFPGVGEALIRHLLQHNGGRLEAVSVMSPRILHILRKIAREEGGALRLTNVRGEEVAPESLTTFELVRTAQRHTPQPNGSVARVKVDADGRVSFDKVRLREGEEPLDLFRDFVFQDGELRVRRLGFELLFPSDDKLRAVVTIEQAMKQAAWEPDPVEQKLSSGVFERAKRINRGTTGALLVTLEGGTKAIGKIDQSGVRQYAGAEVAAYRLSRLLGLDMVPVTVLREYELDGEPWAGSLQIFIEGESEYLDSRQSEDQVMGDFKNNDALRYRAQPFWFLLGDPDKGLLFDKKDRRSYNKNYWIRPDGKVVSIDHGLAFEMTVDPERYQGKVNGKTMDWNIVPDPEFLSALKGLEARLGEPLDPNKVPAKLCDEAGRPLIWPERWEALLQRRAMMLAQAGEQPRRGIIARTVQKIGKIVAVVSRLGDWGQSVWRPSVVATDRQKADASVKASGLFGQEALPGFRGLHFRRGTLFSSSWNWTQNAPRVNSSGKPERHEGMDIFEYVNASGRTVPIPIGTPIRSLVSGTVLLGEDKRWGESDNVMILSDAGEVVYYNHIPPTVSAGQRVERGDVVGYFDRSPFAPSQSPHLHLEVRAGDSARSVSEGPLRRNYAHGVAGDVDFLEDFARWDKTIRQGSAARNPTEVFPELGAGLKAEKDRSVGSVPYRGTTSERAMVSDDAPRSVHAISDQNWSGDAGLGLAYSRMKFGDQDETERFARELADRVRSELGSDLGPDYVVVSPIGANIPNAAFYLAQAVAREIGVEFLTTSAPAQGLREGLEHNEEWLISGGGRSSRENRAHLAGKAVIFIDDSLFRGTVLGRHQPFLESLGVRSVHPYVLARLTGQGNFENRVDLQIFGTGLEPLSKAEYDLRELARIMNDPRSRYTTRTIKYALELEGQKYQELLRALTLEARFNLYLFAVEYYGPAADERIDLLAASLKVDGLDRELPGRNELGKAPEGFFDRLIKMCQEYGYRVGEKDLLSAAQYLRDALSEKAMAGPWKKGGIDLNSKELKLSETGDKVDLGSGANPAMFKDRVDGLIPVVIRMTPLTDAYAFFAGASGGGA